MVAAMRRRPGRTGRAAEKPGQAAAKPDVEQMKKSQSEWLKMEEDLIRDLCRRCRRAAGEARIGRESAATGTAAAPPVELHPGAEIAASYHRVWPDNLDAKLADLSLDRMEVQYLRMEQRERAKTLAAHYHRQMPSCEGRKLQAGDGVLLDLLGPADAAGNRLSLNVLITRPTTKGMTTKWYDDAQELTIEVLAIRTGSPAPSPAPESAQE
jgi:hypothetical protein